MEVRVGERLAPAGVDEVRAAQWAEVHLSISADNPQFIPPHMRVPPDIDDAAHFARVVDQDRGGILHVEIERRWTTVPSRAVARRTGGSALDPVRTHVEERPALSDCASKSFIGTERAPRQGNFFRGKIRIVGKDGHAEGVRQMRDTRADVTDTDKADDFAGNIPPHQFLTGKAALAPQAVIGFADPLGNPEHHADRVLRDSLRIASGLVDDDHAGLGTGGEVARVIARPAGRDAQELWTFFQQIAIANHRRGNSSFADEM